MMSREDPQMRIRLPEDVKRWVEDRASQNLRSQNAEIVVALREQMKKAEGTAIPSASN